MELILRRYGPSNRETIMQLHIEGVEEIEAEFAAANCTPAGADDKEGSFSDDDLEDIPAYYLDAGGDFLVGELDGEVVAIGGLQKDGENRALVRRMRTRGDVRGRGYGALILSSLEQRAGEMGCTVLLVDPLATNAGARRFYKRAGYREVGQRRFGRYDIIIYQKDLRED